LDTKIPTKPVKVMITTDDYEIQGHLHIKVGGYQSRLSDLLNSKDARFIPVTDAVYLQVNNPEGEPQHADTMIVRISSIKAVIPYPDEEKKAAEEYRSSGYEGNVKPKGWG